MNTTAEMDWHQFFKPPDGDGQGFFDEPLLPAFPVLLSSFEIKDDISIGGLLIAKSEGVYLAGGFSIAYLSSVTVNSSSLPEPLNVYHCYRSLAEALAISLTFVTGCKFAFARDLPLVPLNQLSAAHKRLLGLELPLITSGNLCNQRFPSDSDYDQHIATLRRLTTSLRRPQLEPKKRDNVLRSMELLARAISLQQDDHGLALSLTVAAIEAAANARYEGLEFKDFLIQQENEEVEEFSDFVHSIRNDHPTVRVQHKRALRKIVSRTIEFYEKQHFSTRKFTRFVEQYAPYATWDSLARHPWFDLPGGEVLIHPEPPWSLQPSRLPDNELHRLLRATYGYRSNYVHSGLQPPGGGEKTTSTYFETIVDWSTGKVTSVIKLSLLFGIARECLMSWLMDEFSVDGET